MSCKNCVGLWLLAWLFALAGCGSPLVGLECRNGYTRCGEACYDLSNDPHHCGGCAISCGDQAICQDGMCVAAYPDGAVAADGGLSDGGMGDGGMSVDSSVPLPPMCQGAGSPSDCTCGLGQLKCGTDCVDAVSDSQNCGACGNVCPANFFCVGGSCMTCDPPLSRCDSYCVDFSTDVNNCGSCGHACESGICVDGQCIGSTAGHVILIGDDMSGATLGTRRLLGNAVLLPNADPVRVLVFNQKTSPAADSGTKQAIMNMAQAAGRSVAFTTASSLAVTFLLGNSDVFVIEAQATAKNSALIKNGQAWSGALRAFLKRGGVVVLLESSDVGATNKGTFQILTAAGLLPLSTQRVHVGAQALMLTAPGDGVATAVPSVYKSSTETVGFQTDGVGTVVVDPKTNTPVVIHIAR